MYQITETQMDFIMDDIRRNGIQMEDLQLNLLDHICCIVEYNLKEGDDFEAFYKKTIQQFYSKELKEIEEETIRLLTFKNYFMMNKIMIAGGAIATFAFFIGSLFKIMHWPGAAVLLALGVMIFCFLFLPFLFILKSREVNTGLEKLVIALGTVLSIVFCMSILFRVQHWPGANILMYLMLSFSCFVFIPIFFFSGYRKPETRLNTVITSIVLIGFTGISFLAINVHGNNGKESDWIVYCQNEAIFRKVSSRADAHKTSDGNLIIQRAEDLKAAILGLTTTARPGGFDIPVDLKIDNLRYLGKGDAFAHVLELLESVQSGVQQYNHNHPDSADVIPGEFAFLDIDNQIFSHLDNVYVLNNITQLQIFVASSMNANTELAIK